MEPTDIQYFRENVCASCPGTLWGQKSICRIHEKSIGLIDQCAEWEEKLPDRPNKVEQLSLFDLTPMLEILQRVDQELKDYHWMVREIDRLERSIDQAIQSAPDVSNRLVAQYGIEAAMPKGQGKKLTSLTIDENKYERMVKRLEKLKKQALNINVAAESITDDKERTILDCILDGVQMKETAFHVGVSRQRMNEIKQDVIRKMAWAMYGYELKNLVYTSDTSDKNDTSDVSDEN
ncbi:MAG: hypothetical protein JWM44_1344 [Bacilli bacterium]|nr:hypothetical protein [Bacilli bacterium]